MKCVYKKENLHEESSARHVRELTDFGFVGNLSVNISLSRIQHAEDNVDHFWNSEATPNKTITIQADGIA